jgi:hypothetical protein
MAGNASRVRELRGLASVWNDLGLRVLEMAGWEDRGRSSVISFDVLGCHHTAAPTDLDWLLRDGRTGIPGPLCNVALHGRAPAGWKGEVVLIASGRANHFGTASISSSRGLGVEATGPPFPNYVAYVLVAACYCFYYKRDPDQVVVPAGGAVHTAVRRVTAHKHVAQPEGRKINPSFDMGAFLRRVDAARAGQVEEWWQMSIPETELTKIQGAAVAALNTSAGQAAIRSAVLAELDKSGLKGVYPALARGEIGGTVNPDSQHYQDSNRAQYQQLLAIREAQRQPAPVQIDQAAAQAIADALASNPQFLDAIARQSAAEAGQRLTQEPPPA